MMFESANPIPNRPSRLSRVLRALQREQWLFLLTLSVCLGASAVWLRRFPPTYQSKAKVLIELSPPAQQSMQSSATDELDSDSRRSLLNNEIELITSETLYRRALSETELSIAQAPIDGLSAAVIARTNTIKIVYRSQSSQIPQIVLDAVLKAYTDDNILSNRKQVSATRKFIEENIPLQLQELEIAQQKLEEFQIQHSFLGTNADTEGVSQTYQKIYDQYNSILAEQELNQEKINSLKAQLPLDLTTALKIAGLYQDPQYQTLQSKLLDAEAELATLRSRYTNDHPLVRTALGERDQLQSMISELSQVIAGAQVSQLDLSLNPVQQNLVGQWFQLEIEHSAKAAQLNQLSQQLEQLKARRDELPALIKQQTLLQAEVEKAKQSYLALAESYTNSQVLETQTLGNVKLLDQASSPAILSPRTLHYDLAYLLSVAVSFGMVWLRCISRNSLDDIQSYTEILPLPVLATLPRSGDGRLVSQKDPESCQLLSNYQMLQAHIRMLPCNIKVIGVCSWLDGEGSSLVAENLSLLEAQFGRRVLLIKACTNIEPNMRLIQPNHPHKALDKAEQDSSSQITLEATALVSSMENQLWQAPDLNNRELECFDILSYCVASSMSFYKKWMLLLERVSESYDLVVIDCPPASQSASTTMLTSLSDGMLWVAAPDKLGREGAEAAVQSIETWKTRLLGQVVIADQDE